MRRDGWNAGRIWLWLELMGDSSVYRAAWLPAVHDDQAVLKALDLLWIEVQKSIPRGTRIMRIGVTLLELTRASERQLDILLNDDKQRRQSEKATAAIDKLNRKYGRTLVSIGPWTPPPGGYAGGKISYTRIPRAEDFW